ncbi:NERD domain-containing protein [Kitasatospora sp. NBC_01287]|uniref:nuclease-related domain-containing protein n=1 Tax=Kitasatospora sp. NBC_01287 TaxID=2903573 RepID=UPI00225B7892|nr:nuclease-related domain-containing protein [Kitasatospora sp. NBC_01287]MCX4743934.1 NERD domain-containing protein [Kitasatospora sp. NBC_01287]
MAAYLYNRHVADDEYRQRARRHRPSSLLPLVAAAAVRWGQPGQQHPWLQSPYRKYTPWALADIARVALTFGTEFHRAEATEADLLKILCAYSQLKDLTLHNDDGDPSVRLRDFLMRSFGEQFVWQAPDATNLARTGAIFRDTAFPEHRTPQVLVSGWDTDLLGCTLTDYIGVTQTLWAVAMHSQGRFDPSYLDAPQAADIYDIIDRTTLLNTVERHFATDTDAFRAAERDIAERVAKTPGASHPQLRRFTHNPLLTRPAVTGFGDAWLLCPVPQLVHRKAGPAGLYFTGFASHGQSFSIETGYLFEQYVGRQLRLLADADVLPEITYLVGKKQKRESVDWIVVFDDLVLLVEVKACMPTENARLGLAFGVEETIRKIGKAYEQINRTEDLIANGRPAFAAVPKDRPRHGIVVTLEPFPIANAPFPAPGLPTTALPVTVASAQEIEYLVMLTDTSASTLLLARAADPEQSTWSLDAVLAHHSADRNPILDDVWNSYLWSSASRARRQAQ